MKWEVHLAKGPAGAVDAELGKAFAASYPGIVSPAFLAAATSAVSLVSALGAAEVLVSISGDDKAITVSVATP
jgi:hypothetical protein